MLITRSDDGYFAMLLAAAPQHIPAFPKPGFHRILRDISLKPPELGLMPHEMVKSILLPKPALRSKTAIDLNRREVLPRFTLVQQGHFVRKGSQQMNVIRHDHKLQQFIAVAIKMPQTVRHDPAQFRLPEHAGTMPRI